MSEELTTKELLKELVGALKHTPSSTTATGTPFHGPLHGNTAQFGIFSTPGVRPERWSTLARPWSFASILTPVRSVYWQEKLEIMTGQTEGSGDNADNWCDDPPTVGENKVCKQNYNWGDYYIKGKLNVLPYIGQLRDRADVPAEILNAGTSGNPYMPDLMFRLDDTQSQVRKELFNIGVDFERTFDTMLVQGNNASSIGERGWFNDFTGLDLQVKTGYTDADTGLACAAVDSAVETYGANVSTTSADGTGRNIVEVLGDLYYGLTQRASKMGMSGTRWVIVMREELFKSFVDQYSCLYHKYSCSGAQYTENNIDQLTTNQLRLQMYNGRYLLINGVVVPVVFTEGIPQTTPAANTFESDMYIVPINYAGRPLLTLEYFPMDNQYLQEFSNFNGHERSVMNNGMWLASSEETAMCKELHFGTRMRLILETPHLAGRIDDLQYSFNAPIRNALPGASYHANGGVTYRG